MINLKQKELYDWQIYNFGLQSVDDMAWGMTEEMGEMCHFLLKRKQGIREGNGNDCKAEVADAYADIIIFGLQLLSYKKIDAQKLIYSKTFKFGRGIDLSVVDIVKVMKKCLVGIDYYMDDSFGNDNSFQQIGIADNFRKLFYYGAKLVELEGLDPEIVLQTTTDKVLKRDWKNNPTGKGLSQHNQGEVKEGC